MLSAANMSVVTTIPAMTSLDTPPVVSRPNRPNYLEVTNPHNPAQVCPVS